MNTKQNTQDAMKNTMNAQDTLQVQAQQNRTQQNLQDTGANACVPGCGWLKLFRCFTEWEWYSDTNTVRLFLHLLLRVNYRERRWKGITIPRGSMVTSLAALAAETTLSVQNIRTCLAHLKSTGEISVETTPCYTLISVNNYARYQDGGTCSATPEQQVKQQPKQQTSNNPSTHSQQTPNKPLTTTKEIKKEINKENISLERERALEREKSKVDCVKSCAECAEANVECRVSNVECRDCSECALSKTTRNSGSTDYLKNRAAAAESKAAGTTTKGGGRAEAGRGVFTAPSVEQVRQYAAAKGLDGVDAEAFTDYYTAKGWRIGLSPMRDWQAAVRNWARRQELMAECTLRRPSAKPATRTSLNVNDQWKDFVLPQR